MKPKSSAHYQREFRRRLREQGLVKKEVWIRPEHAKQLAAMERQLREAAVFPSVKGVKVMTDSTAPWTTANLHKALLQEDLFNNGQASVELLDGVEPSLQIVMNEYGDLPVFVTVYGEQILVESVLWAASEVKDTDAFNEAVLRTHKYFPLSTISLDTLAEGADYYHMFGALSATSQIAHVLLEIEVLARNVIQATEAYGDFLTIGVEA
jgi:uncharacterized protein